MNPVLALGRIPLPALIKKRYLRRLFACTAAAFRKGPPAMGFSYAGALRAYARFTRDAAEESLGQGICEAELRDRLYRNAYELGSQFRKMLRPSTPAEVRAAMRLLYRGLDIEAEFEADGDVTIRTCYFSPYYTARICQLISALDTGVAAGLSGGGRLEFSQRMTEGHGCCRARFQLGEPG